jgi:hypothetical protein
VSFSPFPLPYRQSPKYNNNMSGSVNKNLNDYGGEPPVGDVPSNSKDDTYASRPGQSSQVPVQKDDDPVKIGEFS